MIIIGDNKYDININDIESINIIIKRGDLTSYFEIKVNGIIKEYDFHWSNNTYKKTMKDISEIEKYIKKKTIRKNKLNTL
ncbi:hypothetical protein M0Q50_07960 [bacterium]|jgi:hypothetical protein|nr:hypothetical protein [bacterium]